MRMTTALFIALSGMLFVSASEAQETRITALDRTGRVSWTCASLEVLNRVEWTASPQGLSSNDWPHQQSVYVTHPSNEVTIIPAEAFACYRVVCELPDPHFPDITAAQALALLDHRFTDPGFAVVDVRRPGEYTGRHIIGAINIDFYSSTFASDLDALDKDKAYIIHCASGYRSGIASGNAHDTMLGLGFHEVYNMLGGMGAFQNVPGADVYLEP